jgi:hypothetical protein
LICDEIGYLPIDRQGANLFFNLFSRRYERGSIIITSSRGLGAGGEVFGDTVIASTILDRLLHHSITINIKGESFRLRAKLKAGLLTPTLETPGAIMANKALSSGVARGSSPSRSPTRPELTGRGEFQMIRRAEFQMIFNTWERGLRRELFTLVGWVRRYGNRGASTLPT